MIKIKSGSDLTILKNTHLSGADQICVDIRRTTANQATLTQDNTMKIFSKPRMHKKYRVSHKNIYLLYLIFIE